MLLGYDIGGTNARAALVDPASGQIVDRRTEPSRGEPEVLLSRLVDMATSLLDGHDTTSTTIGVGIAGLAHRSGVLRYSPNLPEIIEYPIGTELSAAVGCPVKVVNDATAAVWAEARVGAGRGSDNITFVGLGTGIGTGFVVNGIVVEGANGFAGESGHMVVNVDGEEHVTGQRGPWELYASGNGLGRMARAAAEDGTWTDLGDHADRVHEITGFQLIESLERGDAPAAEIFDRYCYEVALGIGNLILILDSERVILGGGLADIGEPLRAGVDRHLPRVILGQEHRPLVDVVLAELGPDAGLIGAALMSQQLTDD